MMLFQLKFGSNKDEPSRWVG